MHPKKRQKLTRLSVDVTGQIKYMYSQNTTRSNGKLGATQTIRHPKCQSGSGYTKELLNTALQNDILILYTRDVVTVTTRNLTVCYSRGCRIVVRGCEFWISLLGQISVTLSSHSRTRLPSGCTCFPRRRCEWWHEIPYVTFLPPLIGKAQVSSTNPMKCFQIWSH